MTIMQTMIRQEQENIIYMKIDVVVYGSQVPIAILYVFLIESPLRMLWITQLF